ncbi:MAG: rubrerythrin family protein [Actinomycetota bacterium]|nr:rubrerythrin family protein [Actinomycetota bacterium]
MNEETRNNLKEAFAGESQANRTYLAFAQQAEKEGFSQAAKLLRAAADSETVHALKHIAATGKVGTTEENLKEAITGENYEFQSMYPRMIEAATGEEEKAAKMSFENANAVEKEHSRLFGEMLSDLAGAPAVEYWVCQNCGHVHIDEAPEKCPVCNWPRKFFKKID